MSRIDRFTKGITEKLAGLLDRRTLHVYLAPQQITIALRRQGHLVEGSVQHLPLSNPTSQWQIPVTALRKLLSTPTADVAVGVDSQPLDAALAARAPLHISLAGRWCPAVMAPWSDVLMSEPGATRFLQMQLSAVYGDNARSWQVACDDAPFGEPRLACGLDGDLLQVLQGLCADLHFPCAAMEPVISTVCGAQAAQSGGKGGKRHKGSHTGHAIALLEQGRLTMAALDKGRVAALTTQAAGGNWAMELPQAWQRWALRTPILAGIAEVAVVDLSGHAAALAGLPALFRVVDTPFGSPFQAISRQEAA